ncbi:MAG: hypothetical protein E6K69_02565 [Nitrospirae bacterium]|nr:MAG: hypothetical protein E6K69_02565 [Nitrospirota bacterium]
MNCHRCNGLMVVDHFIDMEDEMGCLWMRGWRCMNCGDVEDPEIYRHRMIQSSFRDRVAKMVAPKRARKSREVVPLSA